MEKDTKGPGVATPLAVIDVAPDRADSPRPTLLPEARQYKTLRVVLIKPSKYDDDG